MDSLIVCAESDVRQVHKKVPEMLDCLLSVELRLLSTMIRDTSLTLTCCSILFFKTIAVTRGSSLLARGVTAHTSDIESNTSDEQAGGSFVKFQTFDFNITPGA